MHQDFEKYRLPQGGEFQQLNVRVSPEIASKLKTYAGVEGDSVQALATEGLARVIEDRVNNPNPQLQARIAERRAALLEELNTLDTISPDTLS
jgi:hypothetical protein